jgi:hypothetical protein
VLQEFTVDIGGNVTLPCTDSSTVLPLTDPHFVIWVREGRDDGFNRRKIEPDGALTLTALERDDAGIYACTVEGEYGSSDSSEVIRSRVKVEVRSESENSLFIVILTINFLCIQKSYPLLLRFQCLFFCSTECRLLQGRNTVFVNQLTN